MDTPMLQWIVSPPAKWQNEDHDTLPKIVCALHDEPTSDLVTNFSHCDADYGSASSRASSLESETNLVNIPSITLNDYCEAEINQTKSLPDDFAKLSLQRDTPNAFTSAPNENTPVSEKFQGFRRPAFRRSYSRQTILIRLSYIGNGYNCGRAPKTVIMTEKQHFQVLLGSVAQSLSVAPESVSLWTIFNSQETVLSPIVSPCELGFSGEVEINVRIGKPKDFGSNRSDLSVGHRIPGTNWVRSFPSKVYNFGLPKSPVPPRTIMKVASSAA